MLVLNTRAYRHFYYRQVVGTAVATLQRALHCLTPRCFCLYHYHSALYAGDTGYVPVGCYANARYARTYYLTVHAFS